MDSAERSRRARQMVAEGAVLLDVRSPAEFAGGHLPGAVNIPVQVLPERLDELSGKRTAVVYCAAGIRSAKAEEILRQAGFTDVLNIVSMAGW